MPSVDLGKVVGSNGVGVPTGGSAGAVLIKSSASDYDTKWDVIHPVGSYYWSEDSTSPATKFGGTWTQITTGGAIVIEQGTSNIWTYRKFSDGISECWGQTSYSVSSWDAFGSVYEANPGHYINYPTDLFIDVPILNVTPGVFDGAVTGIETYTGHTKLRTPTMYGIRPDSGGSATRVVIQMHAIGAWSNQHTPFYLWVRTA